MVKRWEYNGNDMAKTTDGGYVEFADYEARDELLATSLQFCETLLAVYRHRGNTVMAEQLEKFVQRLQAEFPREPWGPMLEQTKP